MYTNIQYIIYYTIFNAYIVGVPLFIAVYVFYFYIKTTKVLYVK